jgi:hypothetical protein
MQPNIVATANGFKSANVNILKAQKRVREMRDENGVGSNT